MERCSRKDDWVANASLSAQDVHKSDGMIDVRARVAILAPLHAVLLCGELNGCDHQADVIGTLHLHPLTCAIAHPSSNRLPTRPASVPGFAIEPLSFMKPLSCLCAIALRVEVGRRRLSDAPAYCGSTADRRHSLPVAARAHTSVWPLSHLGQYLADGGLLPIWWRRRYPQAPLRPVQILNRLPVHITAARVRRGLGPTAHLLFA